MDEKIDDKPGQIIEPHECLDWDEDGHCFDCGEVTAPWVKVTDQRP